MYICLLDFMDMIKVCCLEVYLNFIMKLYKFILVEYGIFIVNSVDYVLFMRMIVYFFSLRKEIDVFMG